MNLGLRKSIGVRLLRIVFVCYLVVTIIVTATQLYFEYSNVEKGVITELYNVGRSFEDGLSTSLWTLNNEAIDSMLSGVQKIEAVAGVKVTLPDGVVQSVAGVVGKEIAKIKVTRELQINEVTAKEIAATIGPKETVLYEYRLDIFHEAFEVNQPDLIGYVYIYATRDTVINRFKNSFFLILINAVIKTAALWIIFLYFSRRLLSRPLSDLTSATAELSTSGVHSKGLYERLKKMANSSNKNELQQLAHSFLAMRELILDRIENLNTLNHFAIALTQADNPEKIYERLFYQMSQVFGFSGGLVFDKTDQSIWQSDMFETTSGTEDKLLPDFSGYNFDVIRGRNEIVYAVAGKDDSNSVNKSEWINSPFLYLPLCYGNRDKCEMWLLGEIKSARLDKNQTLNDESLSFLQVVSNIVNETLTSNLQRKIIEDQNKNLENRVVERTEELASANRELRHIAVHDPLTQLPNRTLFNDRLQHMIDVAIRANRQFAVASIDLTVFKQINDSYGHDAGDTVLLEIASRFSKVLRKCDTLARMGGDEFAAIIVSDNINTSVHFVLSRLLTSLHDAIPLADGQSLLANANIGVAFFPDHGASAEVLFKYAEYADIAMYQAKRSGDGYAVFDKEKNSKEKDYLQFMYELEHAIERDQLRLYYQPILDLKTGRPVSFEALLRWDHPERGIVPPGMFISHAEKTPLIKPITFWVLREACRQCEQWHQMGIEVGVSVNISARIFSSPDLLDQLEKIIGEFDIEPRWLKLEITESAAMTHPEKALATISAFSAKGFAISIDDFGTGHSSLSYLTRLPIDEIKIDRSFLASRDESSRIVVQTIIELAHTLKYYVVAEGIEDQETLDDLVLHGCDAVQGFYLCRPDTAETIEAWFREHSLKDRHL